MLPIERLISHRFRGFAREENTVEGLVSAMSAGVQNLEFDIRVAKCGTPMIYHDEFALDGAGDIRYICDVMARDFGSIGGRFATIPSAEDLLGAAGTHANKTARLLIDIKDVGFEVEIHALVVLAGLEHRVTYVSWLAQALYQIHDIAPDAPLCLSHWCKPPHRLIRESHTVFEALDGVIAKTAPTYFHGERGGHYVKGGLRGTLRDLLIKTSGSICVPRDMVSAELVSAYQADGIKVSIFSYTDWPSLMAVDEKMRIDLYFIDNKTVFDDLIANKTVLTI